MKSFFLILFFATISVAENADKSIVAENEIQPQKVQTQVDKSGGGFAIHIGAGELYGGSAGISFEYQYMIKPKIRLTPFVSVTGFIDNVYYETYYKFGYCLGVNAEFGKFHRLFVGPSFGTHLIEDRSEHLIKLIGPSVAIRI